MTLASVKIDYKNMWEILKLYVASYEYCGETAYIIYRRMQEIEEDRKKVYGVDKLNYNSMWTILGWFVINYEYCGRTAHKIYLKMQQLEKKFKII